VPDAAVLRARKIVNVRELIRFELESLSVALPSHKRVHSFDVTMEPLPRTVAGTVQRAEMVHRCRTGQLRIRPGSGLPADGHIASIVAVVQAGVRPGIAVHPDSNLELDLELDSLDRVELLASLEQRFGKRIPDGVAQTAFLVRDIAEALRGAAATSERSTRPWASLLETEQPDAELRALLRPRLLIALIVYGFVRLFVRSLVRPRVEGLEHLPPHGPFILTPNHHTYIDPLVVECALPFRIFRRLFFVGATEYFETPLTAWLARALNIVPVDPDANLLRAMRAAAFGLKHGKVLLLFPEGERSIDGTVKPFRKGAAILSQHLNVPIVPVAINGLFELWPRGRSFAWKHLLPWSGHRTSLRFGAPISARACEGSYADHTETVRAAVEKMWLTA
jgi:long-chain acyl-CoA synthetase